MTTESTHDSPATRRALIGLVDDGAVVALEASNGQVAVHRDYEDVTERPSHFEARQVTGVEEVEDAVRDDHTEATRAPPIAIGEQLVGYPHVDRPGLGFRLVGFGVDQLAQHVAQQDVALLDARRLDVRCADDEVGDVVTRESPRAGECDRSGTDFLRRLEGSDHVR